MALQQRNEYLVAGFNSGERLACGIDHRLFLSMLFSAKHPVSAPAQKKPLTALHTMTARVVLSALACSIAVMNWV